MNQPKTMIFRCEKRGSEVRDSPHESRDYRFVLWRPSFRSLIPPGKGKKYLAYWLFHLLGVFHNADYSAVSVYWGEQIVSSLLIVPAHFKWPFMGKNDLQLTYVLTHQKFRGKGLAEACLCFSIEIMSKIETRVFWYVTDSGNPASQKLCTKVGFEFFAYGERTGSIRVLETR